MLPVRHLLGDPTLNENLLRRFVHEKEFEQRVLFFSVRLGLREDGNALVDAIQDLHMLVFRLLISLLQPRYMLNGGLDAGKEDEDNQDEVDGLEQLACGKGTSIGIAQAECRLEGDLR